MPTQEDLPKDMTYFRLLDLPVEIIQKILSFVHPADLLLKIAPTSSFIHRALAESIELQYSIALYHSGMCDNPIPNTSIQQRMERLQQREEALLSLKPSFVRNVSYDCALGGLYELADGFLFLGDKYNRERLLYLSLPTSPMEDASWKEFCPPQPRFIVDFGLSVEDELIVLVQM